MGAAHGHEPGRFVPRPAYILVDQPAGLARGRPREDAAAARGTRIGPQLRGGDLQRHAASASHAPARAHLPGAGVECPQAARSEEHTSELQSLMRISYAVFCLKKNNDSNPPT